jgi:chromosomal replication initiation ATPase DnaA
MTNPIRRLTAVPLGEHRPGRAQDNATRLELAEAWNEVLRARVAQLQAQLDAVTEVYCAGPVGRLMRIAKAVAAVEMVSVEDLRGRSAERAIAWPRQQFMMVAREAGHSLQDIGAFLDRDHTTVSYGVEAATARKNGGQQ